MWEGRLINMGLFSKSKKVNEYEEASNNLEFERAMEYRDTINSINEIVEKQTMELNDGLSKDIFGYYSKDGLVDRLSLKSVFIFL